MYKIFKVFLTITLICSLGCQRESKMFDFNSYSMNLPSKWKKIEVNGVDSTVYIILTDNGDSIYSDFGLYSKKFNETSKVFSKEQVINYKSMQMDVRSLHWSEVPEIDQSQGTFLKEYYYYDTIDNIKVKIKVPKIAGAGETGICFLQVKGGNGLTISVKNLNHKEQHELIQAFRTIHFKK